MAEETGFAFSMDSFRLDGKVALVTGGSYGIGFAIATALAQAGAKIAFNDRDQQKLEAGLASYAEAGVDARGYLADVTDEAQVAELVANIERDLGGVDILVNNAGIIKRIPMLEMSVEDFRQVVDVDLNAPFIVAKAVLSDRARSRQDHQHLLHDERTRPRDRRRLRRSQGRTQDAGPQHLL